LEGKQIWYITAPASVPLSSIEQVSLRDIEKNKKVLSHMGNDYGFIQDAAEVKTYSKIMTPNSSDDGYRTGKYDQSKQIPVLC
jgi:DNA-directed RNA polymerase I subunit RPA34.5